jgi:hypothetical protein
LPCFVSLLHAVSMRVASATGIQAEGTRSIDASYLRSSAPNSLVLVIAEVPDHGGIPSRVPAPGKSRGLRAAPPPVSETAERSQPGRRSAEQGGMFRGHVTLLRQNPHVMRAWGAGMLALPILVSVVVLVPEEHRRAVGSTFFAIAAVAYASVLSFVLRPVRETVDLYADPRGLFANGVWLVARTQIVAAYLRAAVPAFNARGVVVPAFPVSPSAGPRPVLSRESNERFQRRKENVGFFAASLRHRLLVNHHEGLLGGSGSGRV